MNLLSISISKICIDLDFLLKTKLNGSPMCCVCCSFLNCLQKLNLQDCYYQIYICLKKKTDVDQILRLLTKDLGPIIGGKNVQIVTLGASNALATPLKINVTLPSFDYLPLDFSNPRRVFNPPF